MHALLRLHIRGWNPATLPSDIADEQPTVPGLFDNDFLSRLHREFACRVILLHGCLCPFPRKQLDRNPSFPAIRSRAPSPTRKLVVFACNLDSLTSLDLQRIAILDLVLQFYATFAKRRSHMGNRAFHDHGLQVLIPLPRFDSVTTAAYSN